MQEHRLQIGFILVLLAATVILTMLVFLPYFHVLFLAGIFAVVLKPLANWFARLIKYRTISSMATVATVLLCIILPLTFFGFLIFREANQVYANLTSSGMGGENWRNSLVTIESYIKDVIPGANVDLELYLEQALTFLVGHLDTLFSGLVKTVFTFFLLLLGLFYLFRDGREIKQALIRISPLSDSQDELLLGRVERAINSVVRGFLVVAIIQGVLTGIGLTIFGVPAPVLWAVVASVAALVPGVGTSLVIAPAIIYLFYQGNLFAALGLLVWGVTAVGLIDNILGPILIRRGLEVHPFLILLSVLGGLSLFGPIGFLAGPVTVGILIALFEIAPKVIGQKG